MYHGDPSSNIGRSHLCFTFALNPLKKTWTYISTSQLGADSEENWTLQLWYSSQSKTKKKTLNLKPAVLRLKLCKWFIRPLTIGVRFSNLTWLTMTSGFDSHRVPRTSSFVPEINSVNKFIPSRVGQGVLESKIISLVTGPFLSAVPFPLLRMPEKLLKRNADETILHSILTLCHILTT